MSSATAVALYAAASVACSVIIAGWLGGRFDQPAVQVALDRASMLLAEQAMRTAAAANGGATLVQPESDPPSELSCGQCVCECSDERSALAASEQQVFSGARELWQWQCGTFVLSFVLAIMWYRGARAYARLHAEQRERLRMGSELERIASAITPVKSKPKLALPAPKPAFSAHPSGDGDSSSDSGSSRGEAAYSDPIPW